MTDSLLRALVARNRWLLARPAASALLVSLRRLVSARLALVSARPATRATGLAPRWFSSSRATGPSPRWFSSGRATGPSPRWFSSGRATGPSPRWFSSGRRCVHLLHDPRCVHLLHDSVPWSRPKVSCSAGLVAGSPCPDSLPPLFLSAAQSPARANSAGIRSLSSVPHLWSSSFDCPASQVKRRPKCDRIAPSHPLSWPCVSDLLLLKGES